MRFNIHICPRGGKELHQVEARVAATRLYPRRAA